MFLYVVRQRLKGLLERSAERKEFPAIVGGAALLSTFTATVPVEILIIFSTLWSRRRWLVIAASAAFGSAAGAVALYLIFHHLGWALVIERYPDLVASRAWSRITGWLSDYGIITLFMLMTFPLPIPKLAAIAIAAIYRFPITDVSLAILIGKLIKYSVYAFVVARSPEWFRAFYENGKGRRTRAGGHGPLP